MEGPGDAVTYSDVLIYVQNVNEAPSFNGSITVYVDENTPGGTTVVQSLVPYTLDPDLFDSHTYVIFGGNTDNAFDIDTSSGQITVGATSILNYESIAIYTLTVRVDDGFLYGDGTLTIHLNDVNEAPTLLGTAGTFASIAENSAINTVISTLIYASDPDGADVLTFSILSGNTNNTFSISKTIQFGSSAGQLTVIDNIALDYETRTTMNVRRFFAILPIFSSFSLLTFRVIS